MYGGKFKLIFFTFFYLWLISACQPVALSPPYGRSSIIKNIVFDWSSHIKLAPGSDNWPLTWADDGHQYTSWGDGGGFGGSNSDGRVSLGVARVEGSAASYKVFNVWGGKMSEHASQFGGKSYGIISIDGVLYKWVSPGSNVQGYQESRLYLSKDHGAAWSSIDWAFDRSDGIVNPAFCQFGKDYQGARDNYVYIYASHIKDDSKLDVQRPGEAMLMRVPKISLLSKAKYEYYAGLDNNKSPLWSKKFSEHKPVFIDENGVGWNLSVSYNASLKRYLLMTEHTRSMEANIGIFDAPEPWGPWSTVYYGKFGGESDIMPSTFYYNFSNKWLSSDGLQFTMVFTGIGENDAWNTVSGKFVLTTPSVTSGLSDQTND
ncbi:MAG: hypothetical protein BMS9Abin19_0237 [Gammaproteobacteria bacterium]|nr:MAG: hypothetical protein BMS9Abin19_0237 [Gammaproteobacteria bacterium]